MNNTIRYIVAGILIFLIILLQPIYLKWLGYDGGSGGFEKNAPAGVPQTIAPELEDGGGALIHNDGVVSSVNGKESYITISTPLYTATMTNRSGGSFISYTLAGENSDKLKYIGGYNENGSFQSDLPVSIIMPSQENCMPCLASFDNSNYQYNFINQPFTLINFSSDTDTVYLDFGDSIELKYVLLDIEGGVAMATMVS